MLLAIVVLLAQAGDPEIPVIEPKEGLQVNGTAARSAVDREGPRQAALADALRQIVEASGGKVSENVAGGTATRWRARFPDGVLVVADLVKKGEEVAEDTTRVDVSLPGGATATLEVRKGHTDRPLDGKVVEAAFGANSATCFRIVREYEAGTTFVVELAYVLPEAPGEMVPVSPGRRWTWKFVQRWPADASKTIEEEVSASVEKVENGLATLRVNHSGTTGSRSDEVDIALSDGGPLIQDIRDINGSRVALIKAGAPTEIGLRWMTERMQRVTLPGLFASIAGHLPFTPGAKWTHAWEGETSEGTVSYEEEATVPEARSFETPAGPRAGVRVVRTSKERLRINLGMDGFRLLIRTRTWEAWYADGVGCIHQEESEKEGTTTTDPDGKSTDPVYTEVITTWDLTDCTGAR
ncbi:MAG: hypothetical protein AAB434_07800 [Planctomycetota bacterium]